MKNNINIKKLVRNNILNLTPYRSAREEINKTDAILLDANENPFPLGYNRYPDPLQKELKKAISTEKGIPVENIFLGNGSDEIIDLLFRVFCIPGKDSVIINTPTYGMYEVCAKVNDVQIVKINLDDDFQIDLESICDVSIQAKMIFICSPNNPTGNLIEKDLIVKLLNEFKGIIIIDEAYIDFAEDEGFTSYIKNYPNLVVLQTFSKARAMAGIRIGMAFMNSEIVEVITKIKYPYNISYLNQQAALKAIMDKSGKETIRKIIEQREWLSQELTKLEIVAGVIPSVANFLLVKFLEHKKVYQFLSKKGIIVRDRSQEPKCEKCLRITVGKPSENSLLLSYLKQFEQINQTNYEKNTIS